MDPNLPTGKTSLEPQGPSRKGVKDQIIERFEQKYIVPPELVPEIREFIKPFCIPDPNGKGKFPEYTVTTLQLDTPAMDLALAKERKTFARFKLRIRTYGTEPHHPVFFELKRKVNNVIIKSRAKMTLGELLFRALPRLHRHPSRGGADAEDAEGQQQLSRILPHRAKDFGAAEDVDPLHPRIVLRRQ